VERAASPVADFAFATGQPTESTMALSGSPCSAGVGFPPSSPHPALTALAIATFLMCDLGDRATGSWHDRASRPSLEGRAAGHTADRTTGAGARGAAARARPPAAWWDTGDRPAHRADPPRPGMRINRPR